jgi:hypothetical protein
MGPRLWAAAEIARYDSGLWGHLSAVAGARSSGSQGLARHDTDVGLAEIPDGSSQPRLSREEPPLPVLPLTALALMPLGLWAAIWWAITLAAR